jgi:hypothetical protein
MCATTLRRNLDAANRRREENKLAEAKRQESERLALAAAAIADSPSKDKLSRRTSGDVARTRQLAYLQHIGASPGGPGSIAATGWALLQPDNDPETVKAAEDSLLKLLPAVGNGLTMNDALILKVVHRSGHERVWHAMEGAWLASGFTPVTIGNEANRRFHAYLQAKAKEDIAKAKEDEAAKRKLEQAAADAKEAVLLSKVQALSPAELAWAAENHGEADVKRKAIEFLGEKGGLEGIAVIGRTLLQAGLDPETKKAAEFALLKLLPTVGRQEMFSEASVLLDVYRSGNLRVAPAIKRAWEAHGLTKYAVEQEIFIDGPVRRAKDKTAKAKRQESERLALAAARAAENANAATKQPANHPQKDQPKEETRPATPSTDESSATSNRPGAENNDQPPAKETDQYIKEQIRALKSGQRPVAAADAAKKQPAPKGKKRAKTPKGAPFESLVAQGKTPPVVRMQPNGEPDRDFELRRQAADNLKALGPKAVAAAPELANAAINDKDGGVRRKAIEALGEIGMPNATGVSGPYNQAINALGFTLFRSGNSEWAKAAEVSLLKLLPFVGKSLTIDNAMLLLLVHELGNKRVAPAIESAWAARGFTKEFLTDRIVQTAYVDFITGKPRKNPQPDRPFPDHYYVNVTPEGKIQLRSKSALDLWREAHPDEWALEQQKLDAERAEYARMERERNANKEGARVNWDKPKTENQLRQEMINRQNREMEANRVR